MELGGILVPNQEQLWQITIESRKYLFWIMRKLVIWWIREEVELRPTLQGEGEIRGAHHRCHVLPISPSPAQMPEIPTPGKGSCRGPLSTQKSLGFLKCIICTGFYITQEVANFFSKGQINIEAFQT